MTGHPKSLRIEDARERVPAWSAVADRGLAEETATVLARFGLAPNPTMPVPGPGAIPKTTGTDLVAFAEIGRVLAVCVTRTGCAHFGLLVGQGEVLSALASAGCLIPGARTVGEALGNLVGHLHAHAGAAAPTLRVDGPVARLGYAVPCPPVEGIDQVADLASALAVSVMRTLCGANWDAAEVTLPRSAPADPMPFTRHYRSPVRFGARAATVAFPVETLDRPIEAADLLRAVFAAHHAQDVPRAGAGFGEDVRRVLRARLPLQDCSAEVVAASFSMHRRTLNRHLRAEGLSFKVMVNEVRFEIARRLIANAGMSLGQIAAILYFSEPSAFTRAFRRWSGQSPTAWRAGHPAS